MTSNITKPSDGSKREYPPDMILDKDNSDYISQMLREKRQSDETAKQSKIKNNKQKIAVPPFMKGLHQMQQMQLQLAQKQQQQYSQYVSQQEEDKKQSIITSAAGATQQQTQFQSTMHSENSTQSSQYKEDNINNMNKNNQVIQGQQNIINSQIPAMKSKDNSKDQNNNGNQDIQQLTPKQAAMNSQVINGKNLVKNQLISGQKQSTQQQNNQAVLQDNSVNANQEKQINSSLENKLATQQNKISSTAYQSNESVETKLQDDKVTQRKTIHSQQPKLFDQFFRNENNNQDYKILNIEQKQQFQQINNQSYEKNINNNNNNSRTTRNSKSTNSKITENIGNSQDNKNQVDNQLENNKRINNKNIQCINKSNESSSLGQYKSMQFPQTTKKQTQDLQKHQNDLQRKQQNQLEQKQNKQEQQIQYYSLPQQSSPNQGEFINASLENSLADIQENFLPSSKIRKTTPTTQFNSLEQGSFNISNISNIQNVSNNNVNNISSVNNHSNMVINPNQFNDQNQNVSFHQQVGSQIRLDDYRQINCSIGNYNSIHKKNSLEFLHALDTYIDYFETTSVKNSNNNSNITRQQQQDNPQGIYHNRAFLISQLEQLSQKYKESETSRGILINDLSKTRTRHFQLKKKMQSVLVRITELESALSLTSNRLLYTKEQLARDNVELENTKFTLQQVLQQDRNIGGTLRGEDDLGQYYQGNTSQFSYKNWNSRRNTQPHPLMNISVSPRISIPDYLSKTSLKEQLLSNPQEYPTSIASTLLYSQKPQYLQNQTYLKSNSRSSMNVSPDKNINQFNYNRLYENGEKGIQQQNYNVLSLVQENEQIGVDNYHEGDEFDLDISSDQCSPQPQDEFLIQHQYDQYEDSNFQLLDQQQQYQPESRTYDELFDSNIEDNQEYQTSKQYDNNKNKYKTMRLQRQQDQGKLSNTKNDLNPNISILQQQQQQKQAERSQGMSSNHKKAVSLDEEEHQYQMLRLKHFEGQIGGRNMSNGSTPYSFRNKQLMSSIGERPSNGYNPGSSNQSNYTSFQDNLISQKIQFNSANQPNKTHNNFNKIQNILGHHGRTMSLSYARPTDDNNLEANRQFYLNQNQFTNQYKQMPL